ncbi:AMP-binding protein, partial [Pseudoalteromonas piscicida]
HVTYKELNDKSNQIAHYLRDNYSIQPDTLIGLCVGRSLEMVVGLLGILKAGGAYVPLDPSYPVDRLRHMLDDSGLDLMLTQGE